MDLNSLEGNWMSLLGEFEFDSELVCGMRIMIWDWIKISRDSQRYWEEAGFLCECGYVHGVELIVWFQTCALLLSSFTMNTIALLSIIYSPIYRTMCPDSGGGTRVQENKLTAWELVRER